MIALITAHTNVGRPTFRATDPLSRDSAVARTYGVGIAAFTMYALAEARHFDVMAAH
jgi:hypothetical protein